jgi:hypothetical protein
LVSKVEKDECEFMSPVLSSTIWKQIAKRGDAGKRWLREHGLQLIADVILRRCRLTMMRRRRVDNVELQFGVDVYGNESSLLTFRCGCPMAEALR